MRERKRKLKTIQSLTTILDKSFLCLLFIFFFSIIKISRCFCGSGLVCRRIDEFRRSLCEGEVMIGAKSDTSYLRAIALILKSLQL